MRYSTLYVPALVVTSTALALVGALPVQASDMDRKTENLRHGILQFQDLPEG